ncbi:MAG TPA: hypothetical protein VE135_23545 [Pyrinomonadaceae bacterium]|nr:hypothetical protein [Pyrinomonadaceae bacterium]
MPAPTQHTVTFPPISDSLKVDLFFDATLSMKGFTLTQTSSSYQQSVPLLERAVIEGWRGGEASFYKFGDEIAPLPGRAFLEATKPQFYSDSKYNKRTFIERVIDRADLDHLTVIVTDLFQDNADVNQLSTKLKNKFIANGLSVGVLGIRSQYDGTVYDVGTDNYSFSYKSSEKPDSGRPFFLLAFGSHANVAQYFAVLELSGLSNFPERHALILSRFLTAQSAPFATAKLKTANKMSEISSSNLLESSTGQDHIKAFQITKGKTETSFTTEWAYAPLPNVIEHAPALAPELTAWKGENSGGKQLTLVESSAAKTALEITAKLFPETAPFSKLDLQARLNVKDLPASGKYCYRIVLRPNSYSLPSWVSEWNMRDIEIKTWHMKVGQFNGAKTYNLENFLSTLQGAVLNTTPPEVGDIYLYLKVDK